MKKVYNKEDVETWNMKQREGWHRFDPMERESTLDVVMAAVFTLAVLGVIFLAFVLVK